jgi:RNA polymerase sigma-70 factor (ECF subfamily)
MDNTSINYNEVVSGYYGIVLRYLTGIVGAYDAEDLTQEVFIKISNSLASLQDTAKLKPWIFKIAANTARDSFRKNSRRVHGDHAGNWPGSGNPGEEMSDPADRKQGTPEERLLKKEMLECYMGYVKGLPDKYNEVYLLSDRQGLTPQEISEKLSLPLGTVKMRLHRARKMIAGVLKENCTCYYDSRGELLAGPKE